MAKFSVEGEGEGASSGHRKRRREDTAEEGFEESCRDEEEGEEEEASKISITIDPDVLDCSICLEPLIPPVFQVGPHTRPTFYFPSFSHLLLVLRF